MSGRLAEIAPAQGVRLVFDAVGGPQVAVFAQVMSPQGILLAHGALSSERTPFPLKTALHNSLSMRGYVFTEIVNDTQRLNRAKRFILGGLESGALKPVISKMF